MVIILMRIGFGLVFFLLVILNTIYPAFRKDLPLFWMFRGKKVRAKYKPILDKIQEQEIEKQVINEIEERTNNLKK